MATFATSRFSEPSSHYPLIHHHHHHSPTISYRFNLPRLCFPEGVNPSRDLSYLLQENGLFTSANLHLVLMAMLAIVLGSMAGQMCYLHFFRSAMNTHFINLPDRVWGAKPARQPRYVEVGDGKGAKVQSLSPPLTGEQSAPSG
jgi:hypothetical protein